MTDDAQLPISVDSGPIDVHTLDAVVPHLLRDPGATAVIDVDDTVITYGELWERSRRLAERLPIGPGEVVGFRLPRSADVVVAMVAVLMAGGVYAPFSPDDPPARTEDLRSRIGIRTMLEHVAGELDVLIDPTQQPLLLDMTGAPADRPIYVMWTSGSTGEPKAVVVPHRGVGRLIHDREFMDIGVADRLAFASNPMFDAATWEIWAALGNGAGLVVIGGGDLVDAARLRDRFERTGVTRTFLTTSLFNHLTRSDPTLFSSLTSVAIGGEALDPAAIRAVLASDGAPTELLNGYGPTECTTFAVWRRIESVPADAVRIPIGGPIHETELAVVDADGEVLTDDREGELWIGGDGVALGYLDSPPEAARFIDTTLSGHRSARWFRSGDLVRRLPDGALDCLGRIDRQLKVHGYRIEPREIERAITAHAGVRAAAVVALRSGSAISLVGFVETDLEQLDTEAILDDLRGSLPAFMVPARLVVVDRLPTTANGKLDEAALLENLRSGTEVPPVDAWMEALLHPADQFVLECARTVLGIDHLGIDDDLWAAGLDSLSAIELLDMIADGDFGAFDTPDFEGRSTAREMSSVLRAGRASISTDDDRGTPTSTAVILNRGGTRPPIFAVPGAAGTSSIFRPLAQALGDDQPVIVIGPRGMHQQGPVDRTIEGAGEHVFTEIESRLEPGSPCVLLGYSSGASIAFAATTLLARRDVEVRLVWLDAIPGVTEGAELASVRPNTYLKETAAAPAISTPAVPPSRRRRILATIASRRRARRVQRFFDDPGPPSFEAERYDAFLRIAHRAVAAYAPAPGRFPATLIRVDLGPIEQLGEHLVTGLDVHVVAGDHATMLSRHHVHEVVAVLRPLLDDAASPSD